MQVHCPGCSQVIDIGDASPGTAASCPLCTTMFLVPQASPTAAADSSHAEGHAGQQYSGDPLLYERIHERRSHGVVGKAVWTLIVVVFVAAILGGAGWAVYSLSEKNKSAAERGDGWQSLGSFSGTSSGATDNIQLPGGTCQFQWEARQQTSPNRIHLLNIGLYDSHKELVERLANTRTAGKQTATFQVEPGTYYFYVESLAMSWQIDVYFKTDEK